MFSAESGAPSIWARWPASGATRSAETPSKEMRTTVEPSRARTGSVSELEEFGRIAVVKRLLPESLSGAWHEPEDGVQASKNRRNPIKAIASRSTGTPRTARSRGPDGAPHLFACFVSETIDERVHGTVASQRRAGAAQHALSMGVGLQSTSTLLFLMRTQPT